MAHYDYLALDERGDRIRGQLEADGERQARRQLRGSHLIPLELREISGGGKTAGRLFRAAVSPSALSLVTRQLAGLLQSGLPADEALTVCAAQTENRTLERVLKTVRSRVVEGHSLGDAIAGFPHLFSPLYLATLRAGERTRELPRVMQQLADYIDRQQQVRQQINTAMIYPVILVITSLLIIAGLMNYVVPEVVKVFSQTGNPLPTITRWLIRLSDLLQNWGLPVLLLLGLGLAGLLRVLRLPGPRRAWHRLQLSLPLIGSLVRQINAARVCRTLAILLRSGLPMVEALQIVREAATNLLIRDVVEQAQRRVREGESLHRSLQWENRFPPLTLHLVGSGEASGELEKMLDTAAETHERSIQSLTSLLLNLLEPAIILGLGIMVLTIVVAILLPIFELNDLI